LKIQDRGSRHLEKSHKSQYLRNSLTDLHEMWYGDAKWVSQLLRPLKYSNFTNPGWQAAAILKTVKSPYLCNCLTDFDEIWQNDAYCPITADRPLKFQIFENPRWRQPPFWKNR